MKNKVFEHIGIERVAAEGKCIARINGQAVFVNNAAPGDVVDLKITKKKKTFLEGKIVKFHKYSSHRTDPFCTHFGLCGGCKWQHIDYQQQAEAKRQQVIDNFERIGKLQFPEVNQIIKSEKTENYRNKLEYTFSNKRWLSKEEIESGEEIDRNGVGFHIPRQFDKIVDIDKCHLQKEPTNIIRNGIKKFAVDQGLSFYNIAEFQGLLRNLVIRTTSDDQLMVIVQFGENDTKSIDMVMNFLKRNFPQIDSLYYVINTKRNETFHDLELLLHKGKEFIAEKIDDLTFKIGPKSFFQTNTEQVKNLYSKALEMALLTGSEIVYDLYTGTGTIASFFAKKASKVIGIEAIKEAVDDARINADLNQILNVTFVVGDIKETLNQEFFKKYGRPDLIITDPPRAGMHANVIETILWAAPCRIVYISCNPSTQARDLEILAEKYQIDEVQPFDMFPHTHHLENIVSLRIRS